MKFTAENNINQKNTCCFSGHRIVKSQDYDNILANLDKMVGTQEEKDMIAGQLYFFRAWWHFELMTYWGGLPYIDQVFDATQELNLPRLSYQECADKAAADFRRAAGRAGSGRLHPCASAQWG